MQSHVERGYSIDKESGKSPNTYYVAGTVVGAFTQSLTSQVHPQ